MPLDVGAALPIPCFSPKVGARRLVGLGLLTLLGSVRLAWAETETPTASRTLFVPERALELSSSALAGQVRIGVRSEFELEIADEFFDEGEVARAVALPRSLGGGILFYQSYVRVGGLSTRLYHARDYAAPLEPWGTLPFLVQRAVPGPDRIYFLSPGRAVAYSPVIRAATDLGSLPNAPSYSGLEIVDETTAFVPQWPRGILATHDAGTTWNLESSVVPTAPAVSKPSEVERPWASAFRSFVDRGTCEAPAASDRFRPAAPAECNTVHVAMESKLWTFVRVGTRISVNYTQRRDPFGDCHTLHDLSGAWLCVSRETKPTVTLAQIRAGELHPLIQVQGPQAILAVGGGAVLGDSGCLGEPQLLCLFSEGSARSLVRPRLKALAFGTDGKAAFALSRHREKLELRSLDGSAREVFEAPTDLSLVNLYRGSAVGGLHWDGERFGLWFSRADRFVGVRLASGVVEFGPVQHNLKRTSFAGLRALTWGALGFIKETTDGGASWEDHLLPRIGAEEEVPRASSSGGLPERGCSEVGCRLEGGVRWGWGSNLGHTAPGELALISSPPSGAGRYHLSCSGKSRELPPNVEAQAPSVEGQVVSAVGALVELRVAGGAPALFGREARTQGRLWDRFSLAGPMESQPTLHLWGSVVEAETALGLGAAFPATKSLLELPDGSGAMALVRTQERLLGFTFVKNGPVAQLELPPGAQGRALLGLTHSFGTFLTVYKDRGELVALQARGGRFAPWVRWPLSGIEGYDLQLVADDRGRPGIFVDGDRGWFVFPLAESGELSSPIFAAHLGGRPRACADDDHGYILMREFPVMPQFDSGGDIIELSRIWGRHRIDDSGVCLAGLSAQANGSLELEPNSVQGPPTLGHVPLIVRAPEGRPAFELTCW